MVANLRKALGREVDPASLVVFRVFFGLLATAAAIRFVAKGWVQSLLIEPEFHFSWFSFAVVPSPEVLYGLFAVQAFAGLCIAAGRWVRLSLGSWVVSFVFIELLDKSLYLNHYVLFSIVGITLFFSPIGTLRWTHSSRGAPQWLLWMLRLQFASVYFWAGVHKINVDWLLRGEPLATWLQAHSELPWVGPFLAQEGTALAMSWAGMLFDLTVPFLLLWCSIRSWPCRCNHAEPSGAI